MCHTPAWGLPSLQGYVARDNRLVATWQYGPGHVLERTVYYAYYDSGKAAHITALDAGYTLVKDLYLVYASNDSLWVANQQQWSYDPNSYGYDPNNPHDVPAILSRPVTAYSDTWEFRYDRGRQRYRARPWDITYEPGWSWPQATPLPEQTVWTDYVGEQPFVDYTVDPNTAVVTEQARWLSGLRIHASEATPDPNDPNATVVTYLHGDLIDSTMLGTDETGYAVTYGSGGTAVAAVFYTAFGERVWVDGQNVAHVGDELPPDFPRYGYAGGYGYETGGFDGQRGILTLWGANTALPPITIQHVGERWYQPGIGRFVQTDPVGLFGGLNAYAYVGSDPIANVDPQGTDGDPPVPIPPQNAAIAP